MKSLKKRLADFLHEATSIVIVSEEECNAETIWISWALFYIDPIDITACTHFDRWMVWCVVH